VALVSGTSSGIGLRTSVQLVKAGFLVVATMRDLTKRSALDTAAAEAGVTVDVRALDVQSDESVAAGVAGVLERYGRIDLLVNNAGAGFLGTFEQTSMADAQRVFDINYFGVVRLTKAVLPSMREARTGRIVTVSNSKIFAEPVFNYTRDFPFIWEEMAIPISYTADRARAEQILLEAARAHALRADSMAADAKRTLQQRFGVEPIDLDPKVFYRLTDNWLELTVRFILGTHQIRGAKDAMSRQIVAALDEAGIGLASATYDIVGFPPIELRRPRAANS
ncbi:MAG: SDR family NAD(P)-dependent oxidoreductase, partial [Rhodospirillales bacterium]|nr:SDR family NAD(P)-dependent oxidoreductase [Rhodospirillales bacterium]